MGSSLSELFWTWFPRAVAFISLGYNAKFIRDIRRLTGRIVSRGRTRAEPLGVDSGYKGLVCLVSAPFDKDPKKQPAAIESLIGATPLLTNDANGVLLRASPIGAILKAMELHRRHLEHVWFVASNESKAYFPSLEKACKQYFPGKRYHPPVVVSDVTERIDEVYEAVHLLLARCEAETGGDVHISDVITDITGGTKIMSIAAALACLDDDRHIQYLEQKTRTGFYKIDITYEKIAKRPLLEAA